MDADEAGGGTGGAVSVTTDITANSVDMDGETIAVANVTTTDDAGGDINLQATGAGAGAITITGTLLDAGNGTGATTSGQIVLDGAGTVLLDTGECEHGVAGHRRRDHGCEHHHRYGD